MDSDARSEGVAAPPMSEIETNEAPDVVQTDATSEDNDEGGPSTQDATGVRSSITPATISLHAEAKAESNRGWMDVATAWLALLLVVVGVVCALVLLGAALVLWIGYFPTKVTAGKLATSLSDTVAAQVTMSDFGSTKNHLCQDQTAQADPRRIRIAYK